MRGRVAATVVMLAALVSGRPARAQRGDTGVSRDTVAASDSIFLRARRMVLEGNGDAGRALVDSLVTAAMGTSGYADALYWRAALAATAVDAERDYRRVIVEYPFSSHAGDALLALAQLEMARGDRAPAIDHLQRFLLQRPNDPDRVRAGIWLGRLLLEQNQLAKGCAVLLRTRASLGSDAIEIRNQVDYYAARCAGVDTIPPPAVAATRRPNEARPVRDSARRDPGRRDTVRRDTTRRDAVPLVPREAPRRDTTRPVPATPSATSPRRDTTRSLPAPPSSTTARPDTSAHAGASRYTVQVAAYATRDSATALVERLAARGITARLVGATAPFRVRVGSYATEADASAAARDLKAKGMTVFVTTTDIERGAPVRR